MALDDVHVLFRYRDGMRSKDRHIEDAEIIKGTMDDVFLAVTGKELANQ